MTFELPRESDDAGVLVIGTDGVGWLHFKNPIEATLEHITLWADDGAEIKPFNNGQSGLLMFPLEPKAELFLVGLPAMNYTKVTFQTTTGTTGEIGLD
jgi:hypothetical protein